MVGWELGDLQWGIPSKSTTTSFATNRWLNDRLRGSITMHHKDSDMSEEEVAYNETRVTRSKASISNIH